jgi:hypothetical protein
MTCVGEPTGRGAANCVSMCCMQYVVKVDSSQVAGQEAVPSGVGGVDGTDPSNRARRVDRGHARVDTVVQPCRAARCLHE